MNEVLEHTPRDIEAQIQEILDLYDGGAPVVVAAIIQSAVQASALDRLTRAIRQSFLAEGPGPSALEALVMCLVGEGTPGQGETIAAALIAAGDTCGDHIAAAIAETQRG